MDKPVDFFRDDIEVNDYFSMAREYPQIAKHILKQIMLRTTNEDSISEIKNEPAYKEAVEEILKSDDIYEKVHLVLYYDPGLINLLFGSMSNLVDVIAKKPTMATETIKKISDLRQAADLNYDKEVEDKLVAVLEKIIDEYNKEMTDLTKEYAPEMYANMMNNPEFTAKQQELKQTIIDEVRNKGKRVLN